MHLASSVNDAAIREAIDDCVYSQTGNKWIEELSDEGNQAKLNVQENRLTNYPDSGKMLRETR